MAVQMIRGGATIDALTPQELRDFFREQAEIQDARDREALRGKKRMELTIPVSGTPATFYTGSVGMGTGPEEGYVWSLKLAGITLSSSQTLVIYKASSSGDHRRPIASLAAASVQVATWSADQVRLRHGEELYLVAGGAGITGVFAAAWQIPAEREAEIYD